MARHADPSRGPGGRSAADRVRAQLAADHRRAAVGRRVLPAASTPSGTLAVQTLLSSPETGASNVRTMYYLSIVCARESIYIANPYFVPDPVAIETLIDAKHRGVDVRIMVSGIRNDNWLARHNSVRLFGRLLEAGIEIQELQPHHAASEDDGRRSPVGDDRHHELRQSIVRAQRREQRVLLRSTRWPAQLHEIFLDDLGGCERVTAEGWTTRRCGRERRNSLRRSSRSRREALPTRPGLLMRASRVSEKNVTAGIAFAFS